MIKYINDDRKLKKYLHIILTKPIIVASELIKLNIHWKIC
jgi:hypothetical protein